MLIATRAVIALIAAGFAAMIAWAISTGNFAEAGRWLTTDPWGIVTLSDLYFGFLLAAIVMVAFEGVPRGLLWALPLPFLGNVWTAVWFVFRLPELVRRLRP